MKPIWLGVSIILAVWAGGLVWFFELVPKEVTPVYTNPVNPTDAIIVLTGGKKRIQTGLQLLSFGYAKRLFVSGVHQQVTLKDLLRLSQNNPSWTCCRESPQNCCIEIGYMATNTQENAIETASWIEKKNYQSLRLVTSHYHIPRSLFEFRQVMSPSIKIISHTVVVHDERVKWWDTALLLISEYHKFIITVLYHSLKRAFVL